MSTKVAPFLSVKTKIHTGHLAEFYVSRIVSLQDVSKTIVSDRGFLFTLNFGIVCKRLWELVFLSSQLIIFKLMAKRNVSTQVLEDVLRACILSYGKHWEKCLPFAEFSYNISFRASLGWAPFEALYGRRCRTPLNWSETGERLFLGPD